MYEKDNQKFPFFAMILFFFYYCSDATIVGHINKNHFLNNDMYCGIVTADVSDHIPIFLISNDFIRPEVL